MSTALRAPTSAPRGSRRLPDSITIPPELRQAVDEDDYPQRLEWLARLPATVRELAADWGLEFCAQESLDDPTMREPARILAGARAGRVN